MDISLPPCPLSCKLHIRLPLGVQDISIELEAEKGMDIRDVLLDVADKEGLPPYALVPLLATVDRMLRQQQEELDLEHLREEYGELLYDDDENASAFDVGISDERFFQSLFQEAAGGPKPESAVGTPTDRVSHSLDDRDDFPMMFDAVAYAKGGALLESVLHLEQQFAGEMRDVQETCETKLSNMRSQQEDEMNRVCDEDPSQVESLFEQHLQQAHIMEREQEEAVGELRAKQREEFRNFVKTLYVNEICTASDQPEISWSARSSSDQLQSALSAAVADPKKADTPASSKKTGAKRSVLSVLRSSFSSTGSIPGSSSPPQSSPSGEGTKGGRMPSQWEILVREHEDPSYLGRESDLVLRSSTAVSHWQIPNHHFQDTELLGSEAPSQPVAIAHVLYGAPSKSFTIRVRHRPLPNGRGGPAATENGERMTSGMGHDHPQAPEGLTRRVDAVFKFGLCETDILHCCTYQMLDDLGDSDGHSSAGAPTPPGGAMRTAEKWPDMEMRVRKACAQSLYSNACVNAILLPVTSALSLSSTKSLVGLRKLCQQSTEMHFMPFDQQWNSATAELKRAFDGNVPLGTVFRTRHSNLGLIHAVYFMVVENVSSADGTCQWISMDDLQKSLREVYMSLHANNIGTISICLPLRDDPSDYDQAIHTASTSGPMAMYGEAANMVDTDETVRAERIDQCCQQANLVFRVLQDSFHDWLDNVNEFNAEKDSFTRDFDDTEKITERVGSRTKTTVGQRERSPSLLADGKPNTVVVKTGLRHVRVFFPPGSGALGKFTLTPHGRS